MAFLLIFGIVSCNKEPNCNADFNLDIALDSADNQYLNAQVEYILDPSVLNCQMFKSAIQNYLDEAEKLRDCARKTGKEDELQDLIDDANGDLSGLSC